MNKPNEERWLAHYDEGVPHTLEPYPDRTLLDYLADAARDEPDRRALWYKGRTVSWSALQREATECASAFAAMGIKRGDRVALLLPNCPQFLIAEYGAWMLGAVVCPLNPIYTEEELAEKFKSLKPRVVVTLSLFYKRVCEARVGTDVEAVISTKINEFFPPLLSVAFTLFVGWRTGHLASIRSGDFNWESWLAPHRGKTVSVPRPGPQDDALILLSGGTTGTPKGVMAWHQALIMTGVQFHAWFGKKLIDDADAVLLPLPLFHSYGACLVQSVYLIARYPMGLVPNPRDINDLVKSIDTFKPALFAGVPTLYNALLNHPDVKSGKVKFRSLKICGSGAAPLMAETKKRFEEITGATITEAYGMTESLIAGVANPIYGTRKVGSVGMPLPDVHVKIVDAEDATKELAGKEVGQILLRGPQIMRCYFNNTKETAEMLVKHADGISWLHTGDLGYLDEDGYLFIVDRMKDLIKPNGMQVWPREIEEVLATHPAVADVGVRGFPDAARGEIAVAFVVLRSGMQATEAELREFCKKHLAPYKVPTRIVFRKELPKSMIGKVLRRMLELEENESHEHA